MNAQSLTFMVAWYSGNEAWATIIVLFAGLHGSPRRGVA